MTYRLQIDDDIYMDASGSSTPSPYIVEGATGIDYIIWESPSFTWKMTIDDTGAVVTTLLNTNKLLLNTGNRLLLNTGSDLLLEN